MKSQKEDTVQRSLRLLKLVSGRHRSGAGKGWRAPVWFDPGVEGQELVIMSRWEEIGMCGEK